MKNFSDRWYHWAIHDNPEALKNIGLVTSHGFGTSDVIISEGVDLLRLKRPELHAWTTSMTWGKKTTTDYEFVDLIRLNIYQAKVNAVIPWACIQTNTWVGGDPNPGTAFYVHPDGTYEVRPQYYYYKQLTTAGYDGMKVAAVTTTRNSDIDLMAFASGGTSHPNAFIVLNKNREGEKKVLIRVDGATAAKFRAVTTSEFTGQWFEDAGSFEVKNGYVEFTSPARSVTTFYAE